jgi:hypothetical protein
MIPTGLWDPEGHYIELLLRLAVEALVDRSAGSCTQFFNSQCRICELRLARSDRNRSSALLP